MRKIKIQKEWLIPFGVSFLANVSYGLLTNSLPKLSSMSTNDILRLCRDTIILGCIFYTVYWYYSDAIKWQRIRLLAVNYLSKIRAERAYIEINKIHGIHVSTSKIGDVPMKLEINKDTDDIEQERLTDYLLLKNVIKKDIDTIIKELYEKSL